MGFFKSLKGHHPATIGAASPHNPSKFDSEPYAPHLEPPPSYKNQYQSSGGTPFNQAIGEMNYAPPLSPPPGRGEYAPPPGPPPSQHITDREPPPYHDWTSVPDNALLPPPPSLGHTTSPSGNANASDADRAHDWCKAYPMIRPHQPTPAQHAAVANGDVRMLKPPEYKGDLLEPGTGLWRGSTRAGSKDACLLTSSPLYFASADSPFSTRKTKTIYFELKIRSLGRGRGTDESSIALGYCAMPYPTWRMPGWERGSLAVHGDDGRRYVNDTWGGKDFTSPIQVGDTVGLGMSFSIPDSPPEYGAPPQTGTSMKVEVFLTRNGQRGEGWNLHEQLDASNDLGVDGLDGQFDLYGAVGTFGGVEFDVSFDSRHWLWRQE
ncbi:hypothetical protein ABVK25_008146 [Lepraria finkii]|uniref:SPRY domain-containing protein n=1 Tax=Lepraria finkii TaxID=1340010 RepID=A0ABR4B3P2_9LECA